VTHHFRHHTDIILSTVVTHSKGVSVNCEKTEAVVFLTRYQGPEPQHSYTRGKNRRQGKQRSSKKTMVGWHQGLDGEATGGVYSYGQRQGSVENDGASVHGPRPSEMRRGLGKASDSSFRHHSDIILSTVVTYDYIGTVITYLFRHCSDSSILGNMATHHFRHCS